MASSRDSVLLASRGAAARALAQAVQLRAAGRHREAVEAMRSAANLAPGNPQILHDLGMACLAAGLPRDAAAAFRRAIHLKPEFAHACWRLGVALELCGERDASAAALMRATELQPQLPDAQYRLAAFFEQQGNLREAGVRYRRVLTGGPNSRMRRLAEARALLTEGRDAEAERKLQRAVEIDPNSFGALALLGVLRMDAGAFDEAARCFERALAQPDCPQDLYYNLVHCRRTTVDDAELLERLHRAAISPQMSEATQVRLQLALGKALDDLGRFGEAMKAFDFAAEIRARAWRPDVAAFERRVDQIIQRFSSDFIQSRRLIGNPDATPVLIFGMPRSGTTLCEQIVSSHPDVYGAGELRFWRGRAPSRNWHK